MQWTKLPSAKRVRELSWPDRLRLSGRRPWPTSEPSFRARLGSRVRSVCPSVPWRDDRFLDGLAGLTGLGWTTSFLAFLGTAMGYGTGIVTRLLATSHSLLYVGFAFFLATLGIDRLRRQITDRPEHDSAESDSDS